MSSSMSSSAKTDALERAKTIVRRIDLESLFDSQDAARTYALLSIAESLDVIAESYRLALANLKRDPR